MTRPCTCQNTKKASRALNYNRNIPVLTSAIFCTPTFAPTETLAPIQAPGPGLLGRYTDEDPQRVTKLYLESFLWIQEHC